MRILVTGMTSGHVGGRRRIRMFNIVVDSIVPALRELGHNVDHRRVRADEEPGNYDLVVVGFTPLSSVQSRKLIGGYTALGWGVPTLLVFDDVWWLNEAMTTARRVERVGADAFFTRAGKQVLGKPLSTFYDEPLDVLRCMAPAWGRTTEQFLYGWPSSWYGLFPQHRFGDRAKTAEPIPEVGRDRVAHFDPSAFMPKRHVDGNGKAERWALATVRHYEYWFEKQGLSWPVDVYGVRQSEYPILPSEDMVLETYARYAGVLSPPHKHPGSGWFRTRYLHAARAGCVLALGTVDREMFGPLSAYYYKPAELEAMSPDDRTRVADDQAEEFFDYLPFRRSEIERIGTVIEAAVDGRQLPTELRVWNRS